MCASTLCGFESHLVKSMLAAALQVHTCHEYEVSEHLRGEGEGVGVGEMRLASTCEGRVRVWAWVR